MTRDPMLDRIHEMWSAVDPVPDGLVARMQAAAAAEVELAATDLDYELLLLIERSTQLAGTRSASTTYTLRFGADGLDLLVRVAPEADATRLMAEVGLTPPKSTYKPFSVMGKPFDPMKPAEYVASFPIRRA